MTQTIMTLRSLLVPFPSGQVLLPHSSMVETLPYAMPLKVDGAPDWVAGILLWRTVNVPLVNLEQLIRDEEAEPAAYSRIVIVNTLGGRPQLPYFGLLSAGAPHLLTIEREDLATESPRPLTVGLKSWVRVKSQSAVMLNLTAIEEILLPLMQQYA
jgi:chemosensory pili system protein ChpC